MNRWRWILCAVALNACLYAAFLWLDFTQIGSPASTWLKYAGILLCAAITFLARGRELSRGDLRLLQAALLLTVLADTSLLLLNQPVAGVAVFCAVQALHTTRFNGRSLKNPPKVLLFAFPIAILLYYLLDSLGMMFNPQFSVTLLYAPLLLISVASAIIAALRCKFPLINAVFMALGMVLFLLCDVNVALYNSLAASMPRISNAALPQIWLYYLPSQVLLALSGIQFKTNQAL